ncbi:MULTISPECIES: HAMP domain-containing sensor histidine kinase [unclassified Rhizobium]|uniref:sensor histidine kinase n=1 Tax=unclassified Rhizobium TaxID=2613769 RepID=UPI001C829A72|nr:MULTISPECIES: HAMP domain-containing sensor histidine kinase [unclassified Rhizobium]MBX5156476.1 HAMP domain-containing histidine kinase [Rhizobium sp. NZLR8]MBX5162602.1 HAMP domain-containing histidine kinase [Rhizobium sp. NZLR4b]MBX5172438.1 HAMP domain-containing histidine kinase [Rhizobium sp. NZLR1b]MBX5187454.1 HAMP domain-containing histidine kinase [Rhizobium sp. NZLR3b]MBX5193851.1 HAMP domain-containing histidine kinase [Rhizobium sp. NZLR10]
MPVPKVRMKWRPTLALIVYVVLLAVMALPILIVIWFRAVEVSSNRMAPAEMVALAVVFILTLGVAYVLTRTITGPIDALIARTEEIARGGKRAIRPLDSYGTREIAVLSQSFLDLAGRLVDRTEYVRSFAAHVSHELKSPLTAIRGAAELLRDDDAEKAMTKAQRLHFLDNIVVDAARLDALLLRLRELAQAEIPLAEGKSSIRDILSSLRRQFPSLDISGKGDTDISVALPREAAGIVFANLAENAFQHGATLLELSASADVRTTVVLVRDDGGGISEANRQHVFQPFFSTRREQGGTGMGLGIVRAMLSSHGGTIRLLPTTGAGAEFEITMPV